MRIEYQKYRWVMLPFDLFFGGGGMDSGWAVVVVDGLKSWRLNTIFSTAEDAEAARDALLSEISAEHLSFAHVRQRHKFRRHRASTDW